MNSQQDFFSKQQYIYLCLVLIAVFTSFWGYAYGIGDHMTFLPIIEKLNDPEYLPFDTIYSMRLEGYDTRIYYAYLCLGIMKIVGLPATFFLATVLSNIAIGIASYKVTFRLTDNRAAGWLATLVVLTVQTVTAGTDSTMYCDLFSPGDLAFAIGLFMFLAMMNRQFLLLGILAAVSTLMHILIGGVLGFLFFGYIVLVSLLDKDFKQLLSNKWFWAGGIIFLLGVAGHIYPYSAQLTTIKMSDETFIETYGYYRIPHHIIPSYFLYKAELRSLILLILMFCTHLFLWKQLGQKKEWQRLFIYCFTVLTLFLIGGYLFVEIWPSRLWVTLQVYRYYYIIKWLNLILCSTWVVTLWANPKYRYWGLALALAIPLHTLGALLVIAFGALVFLERYVVPKFALEKQFEQLTSLSGIVVSVLVVLAYFLGYGIILVYSVTLLFIALFGLGQYSPKMLKLAAVIHILVVGSLITSWSLFPRYELEDPESFGFSYFVTGQFSEEDLSKERKECHELIEYIRNSTPSNAVFLTPPDEDRFRMLAERAVVVDPRGYPFGDETVMVWRERLETCYGPTTHRHINTAIPQNYIPNYRKMTDEQRLKIAQKYKVDYIVLNAHCTTAMPTIFDNGMYKLIQLK
ncbi:MAG: hypothetical protein GY810_20575 [Aureispira sp.]|nr:hypothetical protein [Aureispira sp.]